MMVRTQVQLTEQQAAALRKMSAERGTSVADLIRQSVDEYVARHRPDRATLVARAKALGGSFDSGLTDVSENHDKYVAESILSE